eukprot:38105-Chlamydomonas_euryale.AAC.4
MALMNRSGETMMHMPLCERKHSTGLGWRALLQPTGTTRVHAQPAGPHAQHVSGHRHKAHAPQQLPQARRRRRVGLLARGCSCRQQC